MFFFFKQKTAYEMRISGWSSDVCSSDLGPFGMPHQVREAGEDLVVGAGDRHPAAVAGLEMAVRTAVERARPHAPADMPEHIEGARRLVQQPEYGFKIGRASCRERVCQYV